MIDISNFNHPQLAIESWKVNAGEMWCVLTKNGSGEDAFLKLLDDDLCTSPPIETIDYSSTAVISFRTLQRVYEHELKIDDTDITDEIDFGTTVCEFLPADAHDSALIDAFNMRHRMNTGFRKLSTGESRKLQILCALLKGAKTLILENPFDSLDRESALKLSAVLGTLKQHQTSIVLLLNNQSDIPDWCEYFALLVKGHLRVLDDNMHVPMLISRFYRQTTEIVDWPEELNPLHHYKEKLLCELVGCRVQYEGRRVFEHVDLKIAPLEHTLITGRNGSGKSTLLQMITGDCPQLFSNDVTVFGYKRGNGETIWDIKKHIGLVSSDLHRSYRVRCNVITVVGSGFYDSIGLYKSVSHRQIALAKQWLTIFGLSHHANTPFHSLSHGEQRLVLIARALVKSPLLLVMDEPTQGLDEQNRALVLSFLDKLAESGQTTIVYVSHREDEHLSLFQNVLSLS